MRVDGVCGLEVGPLGWWWECGHGQVNGTVLRGASANAQGCAGMGYFVTMRNYEGAGIVTHSLDPLSSPSSPFFR